jgi:hypothetical protein
MKHYYAYMTHWNSIIFRGWIEVSCFECVDLKKRGYLVKVKEKEEQREAQDGKGS